MKQAKKQANNKNLAVNQGNGHVIWLWIVWMRGNDIDIL